MQLLWMLLAALGLLIFFWFMSGGYENADLRGIFLAPPAPLGPGDAYGPQIGQPNEYYTNPNPQ